MTEIFDEVCTSYDDCTWIGRDGVKRAIDRLKAAHESEIAELQRQYEQNVIELQRAHKREMEIVRDPQRIGGTLERDSFEYALEQLREFRWQHATNDNDAIPYINGIAKAHEHEMERLRKKCFREGYEAGQRSMDAEELRETLIESLEDKDGNDDNNNSDGCNRNHHRCDQRQVSYDELGNERRKAVRKLRDARDSMSDSFVDNVSRIVCAIDARPEVGERVCKAIADRLIHLLGGDEPTLSDLYGILQDDAESESRGSESARKMTKSAEIGELDVNGTSPNDDGTCPNSVSSTSITDELREWMDIVLTTDDQAWAIADRIDEQFDSICQQQETVLQATIDSMCEEQDRLQERLRTAELGCNANHRLSEANARWCDELVDLLRDAAEDYEEQYRWAQDWHDRAEDMRMERDELQSTIDEMAAELDSARAKNRRLTWHIDQMQGGSRKWREKCEAITAERDELQTKLDDYDKTHTMLPKDANGEVIHVGDEMDCGEHFGIQEVEGFVHGAVAFTVCDPQPARICTCPAHVTRHYHKPTIEQVIRDLTLGKITEAQAIERIEGING